MFKYFLYPSIISFHFYDWECGDVFHHEAYWRKAAETSEERLVLLYAILRNGVNFISFRWAIHII